MLRAPLGTEERDSSEREVLKMTKLTRQEKGVVKAYLKMCVSKDGLKPSEYDCSRFIDNLYGECREEMKEFINEEWEKLMLKAHKSNE